MIELMTRTSNSHFAGARALQPNEKWWHAVQTRDRGADGAFVYAVRSTGIYCRPSCASRKPRREQVEFFSLPEAAEQNGFRACLGAGRAWLVCATRAQRPWRRCAGKLKRRLTRTAASLRSAMRARRV